MMLETLLIIGGNALISGLSIFVYHQFNKLPKTKKQELLEAKSTSENLAPADSVGLYVIECENRIMTPSQHLEYLKKLYPRAYTEYKERHREKHLKNIADRYLLRLIVAAENGEIDVTRSAHQIRFGNGDEIWVSNKYYAYGNITTSPDNPQCIFETGSERVSLYTFLRLVNFEETFFDPVLKLNNRTIKVIS